MSRLVLLLLWPALAAAATGEWIEVGRAPKDAATTVLRWRYAVRNAAATDAPARVGVALPRASHGGVALVRVQATEAAELRRDAAGNLSLELGAALAPGETRIVTVTAELASPVAAPRDRVAATTAAGALLDLDAAPVRDLAAAVRAADASQRIAVLWESLSARLEPEGFRASPRRVATTLTLGRGDCTDLALVAVAIARAAGLPARLATGWLVAGSGLLGPDGYHDWAEVHDGTRWRVLDLHARALDPAPGTRVATHLDLVTADVLTAFRFRALGPGLDVTMLEGGGTARGGLR